MILGQGRKFDLWFLVPAEQTELKCKTRIFVKKPAIKPVN
jgi:hypothetical protein